MIVIYPITHVNWHLVNVYPLLDTEFRDQNIESCVQNANNFCLPNDRSIPLSQVSNQDTKEQVV
jgi:hypothetical protein